MHIQYMQLYLECVCVYVICFSILFRDLSYEAQDLIAALLQKVGQFQILHFD